MRLRSKRYSRQRGSGSEEGCLFILFLIIFAPMAYVAEYVGWTMTILLAVAVVGLTVWLLVRRAKLRTQKAQDLLKLRTPTAQELFAKLENVGSMSGGQFEVFIAEVLRALGYKATVLGGSGDQGVDIIAVASDGKVAIQCKNHQKRIGNKPVQEVYAGARHRNCDSAWVVAPAGYTKGAIELARSVSVSLYDTEAIKKWIREIDKADQASKPSEGHPPRPGSTEEAHTNGRATSTPQGKQEMKDGEQYQLLLDLYEKNLKLLETAQMAWEPYIEDPGVRQKFIKTRDHIFNDLEQPMGILEQLDILETRKTGLPNEKKRRAQLKARQERIEKLTGRPADNRG